MSAPFRGRGKTATKSKPHRRPRRPGASTPRPSSAAGAADGERLQKVLAAAGIGSRRQCEELITAGRITVDGKTITELGTKVDVDGAEIRVDGEPLKRSKRLYYLVNKPTGVVSTSHDPSGRPRVIDLLPVGERVYTVGRLDLFSEGLILVTNDGELADLLTHPRYGIEKVYHVQIAGRPATEVLEQLRKGVHLAEGFAHAKRVSIKSQHKQSTILEMVLDEGKNREVRRLLAKVGHKVMWLRRVALGPLKIGDLPAGEFRALRREEVKTLKESAQLSRFAPGDLPARRYADLKQKARAAVIEPSAASEKPAPVPSPRPAPKGRGREERPPRKPRNHPRAFGRRRESGKS